MFLTTEISQLISKERTSLQIVHQAATPKSQDHSIQRSNKLFLSDSIRVKTCQGKLLRVAVTALVEKEQCPLS